MKLIEREPDKGYLDTVLWVPKGQINLEGTKRALTFKIQQNREEVDLCLWQETANHLLLPREFWKTEELGYEVIDCRPQTFKRVDIRSSITLDLKNPHLTVQRDALAALESSRGGVLQLACGVGKTIIFLELLARLKVPALIMVDTSQLMKQWMNSIEMFLDVPGGVGVIKGDRFEWDKAVVLATYQTMASRAGELPREVREHFGVIGWDEGHHVSAPTFARTADLFYGRRFALTATPKRDDGMHVVADFHVGPILFKYLTQELKPKIYFQWTGFALDTSDPVVMGKVCDVNRELSLGKLSGYFGQWQDRLNYIINLVQGYAAQGRKILVLSSSIDELVNLLALWNQQPVLFTDIPEPTMADVGCTDPPSASYDVETVQQLQKLHAGIDILLADPNTPLMQKPSLLQEQKRILWELSTYETRKKIEALHRKLQRTYLEQLLLVPSTAGLMIARIDADERDRMLKTKQVVFAISKYGREGLDHEALDTVISCEPMSSRNTLQQLMGRVLRKKAGKQVPYVIFLEDNIGLLIGMCKKLRAHLREWPHEDGGPFDFEQLDHPHKMKAQVPWATVKIP